MLSVQRNSCNVINKKNILSFVPSYEFSYFARVFALNVLYFAPSSYNWRQLLLINEPEAQVDVAGKSTCHLMIKTFANFLKIEDIIYTPWDTTSDGGLNHTENLKFYLGYKYTSK